MARGRFDDDGRGDRPPPWSEGRLRMDEGFVFLLVCGIVWLLWGCLSRASRAREEARLRDAPCHHGIRGGLEQGLCPICRGANVLRWEEMQRLTRARVQKLDYLLLLSPRAFEDVVAVMFESLGFSVRKTPLSGDWGYDGIARKGVRTVVYECKRYGQDKPVGRPLLQQFLGAMGDVGVGAAQEPAEGWFITTGYFTKTAVKYAAEKGIQLVGSELLQSLMEQAFPLSGDAATMRSMCRICGEITVFDLSKAEKEKTCRKGHVVQNECSEYIDDRLSANLVFEGMKCFCGRSMRVISGRYGKFWGCTGYPSCRTTRPYQSPLEESDKRISALLSTENGEQA
ncbi:MAG TPA: hypothetical protein DEQ28_00340 [Clostridiales bacterium]|nr:hypothetical protein [Clostridiales bacterium]